MFLTFFYGNGDQYTYPKSTHHQLTAGLQFYKFVVNCYFFMVKLNLVKLETSRTVIFPPYGEYSLA